VVVVVMMMLMMVLAKQFVAGVLRVNRITAGPRAIAVPWQRSNPKLTAYIHVVGLQGLRVSVRVISLKVGYR